MTRFNPGRALAPIVGIVAVLNTISELSMPVAARRVELPLIVTWLVLLIAHAGVYWFGDRIRARFDLRGYVGIQTAILFAIAVSRAPMPVTLGVFMAATTEVVVLAPQWGTIRITVGAIALFMLAALISSDLYRVSTAGLMLAITGLLAHAVAALLNRRQQAAEDMPLSGDARALGTKADVLSARELEVLRELVSGARNAEIAARLGISERTVKAHLASIYQKLGVESRSGAVALAVQRKLV